MIFQCWKLTFDSTLHSNNSDSQNPLVWYKLLFSLAYKRCLPLPPLPPQKKKTKKKPNACNDLETVNFRYLVNVKA